MMKKQNIEMLVAIRMRWRILKDDHEKRGFKTACLVVFSAIEANAQRDELWTYLPTEGELTENSRIGDHLAVTRHLLGFIV